MINDSIPTLLVSKAAINDSQRSCRSKYLVLGPLPSPSPAIVIALGWLSTYLVASRIPRNEKPHHERSYSPYVGSDRLRRKLPSWGKPRYLAKRLIHVVHGILRRKRLLVLTVKTFLLSFMRYLPRAIGAIFVYNYVPPPLNC